jgi:hypothetical protein
MAVATVEHCGRYFAQVWCAVLADIAVHTVVLRREG